MGVGGIQEMVQLTPKRDYKGEGKQNNDTNFYYACLFD